MVRVHLATGLLHKQPKQITRNRWFNSNVTWLLKPKLAGVRPYLQVELERSSKSIHLVVIEELGISGLLVQRAYHMTNAVSKNRPGRIYQNRIYGWACPSDLKCWYYSQKMMQNKLKMEFVWSNLNRVVSWDGQRRINLGCRYPHKSLLTCRRG